ncbi:MAG: FlgD immunoglobulin-like domain containing protein [Smithellaceae bacterium]
MRITNSMMVNNMEYWLGKQKEKLNDAQTIVASGQQINKPSDDPAASAQILTDRVTISEYGQYESNIEQAQTWVETSDTTLSAVKSLLDDAQEIISSGTSSLDDTTAEEYVTQLKSIYEQVISYTNSRYGSGYMYSGTNSDSAAFENSVTVSSGTATNVVFDLADAASTVTVEITDSDGNIVRTLTTTGTAGTNTLSWNGLDSGGNALPDGEYSFTIGATDTSGNKVASYPSYRGNDGGKEITIGKNNTVTLNNNGGEIFSAALKALSQAITALKDTDNDTTSASDYSDALETVISAVEDEETTLSVTSSQLTNATNRLDTLTSSLTGKVSDLLLGSGTEQAAVELTAQETAYETTVETAASVLKMAKLNDYL